MNERTSFLKKRSKKLLNPGPGLSGKAEAKYAKVFCFFFSKKKAFLFAMTALFCDASGTDCTGRG